MTAPLLFGALAPGDVHHFGATEVTKDAIIAFAREYDPQPFHLEEEAAKASMLGGLAASGWHSCAMLNRMIVEDTAGRLALRGRPRVREVRWMRPVRPGDRLSVTRTVIETRDDPTDPKTGIAVLRFDMASAGEIALAMTVEWRLAREAEER